MVRIGIAAATLAVLLASARAEDGCDKFAWSLARERALFGAAEKPPMKAGETLAAIPKGAFVLNLQPNTEATLAAYAMPPERKPKAEHWFGGAVRFPAVEKPGIYQVTLSEEAWMDIVQDGRYAHTVGHTGRGDCPGLRKSVRLELNAAPFVLQISGVAADKVVVVIGARE
ncbi:MAG TPA: hypothetical protein VGF53_02460 [Pseudolabrys sp.]|jgi:hypothetical protein